MSAFRVYMPEECGEDGYPFEWHASLKDAVREAAGNRCVRCGHPYRKGEHPMERDADGVLVSWSPCDERCTHAGPVRGVFADGRRTPSWDHPATLNDPALVGVEARARILTVHHLNGVKADCRWWNLASLCQRCHLTIQGRVVMARVWPWEHSEWFRPYVAGYYASVYLGEDLTREETLARLDELLALERAA